MKLPPIYPFRADRGGEDCERMRAEWLERARAKFPERTEEQRGVWADDMVLDVQDRLDLRAAGYCPSCGERIHLRELDDCVVGAPCGHFRARTTLSRAVLASARDLAALRAQPERLEAVERRAAELRGLQ